MNTRKKYNVQAAVAMSVCAMAAAGCASAKVGGGVRPERREIPGEVTSEVTKADASLLTVAVTATPAQADAAELAGRVQTAVEGALIGNGFTIASAKPDVQVALSVRQGVFDKSGEYYLLEGSVPSARVVLPEQGGRQFATRAFPAVRGERVLGLERAVASLGDRLVPDVEKWIADTVRPAGLDMAAVTVVVRRTTVFYKSKDPIYMLRFAERVAKIDGVYSCELVAGDAAARVWEFRIVYGKSKFPGGVLNKVLDTCRDLDVELDR
ncbi:MAG: hypothetical protein IJP66_01015 [Kiritimatiellae bacterium]|nr:hypothetical protein [Kiritimatiellia bacterium]